MQTSFYVSGFIYSVKTHQILLEKTQKADGADFIWSTIGGEGHEGEEPEKAFQRIINEKLGLNLKNKDIYSIYDHFQDGTEKVNFIFYGEIKKPQSFDSYAWVSFSEISKLSFAPRAKQDVIVGERVISAKWREDEAQKIASFTETSL